MRRQKLYPLVKVALDFYPMEIDSLKETFPEYADSIEGLIFGILFEAMRRRQFEDAKSKQGR